MQAADIHTIKSTIMAIQQNRLKHAVNFLRHTSFRTSEVRDENNDETVISFKETSVPTYQRCEWLISL